MSLELKKQAVLHSGLRAGDSQLQITTTGWMMWNQMVNQLCIGMTVVAYDGNPFYPERDSLFDIVDEYK